MDLYKRHVKKDADNKSLMLMGRLATLVFVVIVCLIAPSLGNPKFKGIFNYIQEFQGFISPGILAAFVFGLFVKKTPRFAGTVSLLANVPIYGGCSCCARNIAFLNRMGITFAVLMLALAALTALKPLATPVVLPEQKDFDLRPAPSIKWLGPLVIAATLVLYVIFR